MWSRRLRRERDALLEERKTLVREGGRAATRVAELEEQAHVREASLRNLAELCRQLERKQRDLDEPPISSEDLQGLMQRKGFLERQNEVLLAKVNTLQLQLDATRRTG